MRKDNDRNIQTRNLIRASGLIAIGLATVAIVWFLAQATDTTTTLILANEGNCPRALLQLQPIDGGPTLILQAGPGEQDEIDVAPDIEYTYVMTTDTTDLQDDTEPDPRRISRVCFDNDRGRITVPEGSTFTYRVTSITRPYVVFEVDAACPTATLFLTAEGDEDRDPVIVQPDDFQELEITPDRTYTYSISVVELADPADNICSGVEEAQFTLSMGESRTIRVQPDTE